MTASPSTLDQLALTHHQIKACGTTLHAVEAGHGAPLVLLSGWPQTWYSWHKVMPVLAQHYRVLAVDLPGLGDSDFAAKGYDTGSIALHLDDVLDAVGIDDCLLVTHDIGAWVGYAYAARRPQRVKKLALIDAAIPGLAPPEAYQFTPDSARKIWHFYFNYLPDLPEALIVGREREFITWSLRVKSHDWRAAFTDATIDRYVEAYALPGRWSAAMGYYRDIFESMAQNRDSATAPLPMPVLAVGGDLGLGEAIVASARKIATDVQGAVIPDCGHFVAEEQPVALLEVLSGFLKK